MDVANDPPLLEDGTPDPGRYVARGTDGDALVPQPQRVWDGPLSWRRSFGPAIVEYLLGGATKVENARALDGTRIAIDFRTSTGTWRMARAGGGYLHGHADFLDEDVVFIPLVATPQVVLGERFKTLAAQFRADAGLMEDVADDDLADALYAVLENCTLRPLADGEPQEFGQRSAGRFVAALRGNGEDYNDYFPHTVHDVAHMERMRSHLQRLGWGT